MKYDAVLEGLEEGGEYRRSSWCPLTRVYLFLSIIWRTTETEGKDGNPGDTATFTQVYKPNPEDLVAEDWELFNKPKGD